MPINRQNSPKLFSRKDLWEIDRSARPSTLVEPPLYNKDL
jgi:hypothetical protein